jgi:protein SCO1/2
MLVLALAGTALLLMWGPREQRYGGQAESLLSATLWPEPRPLEDFQFKDHAGRPFGPEQLKGQWSLVFFGYTSCPDICPTTMMLLAGVVENLRRDMPETPRVLLVSVDPDRDDETRLAGYVGHFGEAFVGLRGGPEQLQGFARQAGAMYERGATDEQGNYVVAHTSSVFVVDPRGRLYAVFSPPHQVAAMSAQLLEIRRRFERG